MIIPNSLRPIRSFIRRQFRGNQHHRVHQIRGRPTKGHQNSDPTRHQVQLPSSSTHLHDRFLRRRYNLRATRVIILSARSTRDADGAHNPRTLKVTETNVSAKRVRYLRRTRVLFLYNNSSSSSPGTYQSRRLRRPSTRPLRATRSRITSPNPKIQHIRDSSRIASRQTKVCRYQHEPLGQLGTKTGEITKRH